jgi:hypothetical protein
MATTPKLTQKMITEMAAVIDLGIQKLLAIPGCRERLTPAEIAAAENGMCSFDEVLGQIGYPGPADPA